MKIALTGSSSTGKTTLALKLLQQPALSSLPYLTADARALLESLGYHSMDQMTRDQCRDFQLKYLSLKLEIEQKTNSYFTERSTVDVAAYWAIRDAFDLPRDIRDKYVEVCREHATKFDLHVYLPFGVIPFHLDGYRSESIEFHEHIDRQIRSYLVEWRLEYITLNVADLDSRVAHVLEHLKGRL